MNARPMLWPLLGAVRFILALIVAGTHLNHFNPGGSLPDFFDRPSAIVAVLGFLVISGFSIAASYEKARVGFYRRRALRILPLYFLAILAAVVCTMPFSQPVLAADGGAWYRPEAKTALQNLFFLQGFTSLSVRTNNVVWSLSIEVLFYLLTPLIARLSQSALILISGFSLLLFGVSSTFKLPDYWVMQGGLATVLLGWAWLAGFIVYRTRNHAAGALVLWCVLVGALGLFDHRLSIDWRYTVAIVMVAIGSGAYLRAPAWLANGCERLGDASYPLYLFHLPLYVALAALNAPRGAFYLGLAVALAVVLDRFVDQPFKRLLTSSKIAPAWMRFFSTQKVPSA